MGANAVVELGDLLFDAAILGIPALFGLLVVVRLNVRVRALQALGAFAAPCLVSYISGAFYLISPGAGRLVTYLLYGAVVLGAIVLGVTLRARALDVCRSWSPLVVMTVAAAAFSLGLGYLHGYASHPARMAPAIATPRFRYLLRLPIDTALPFDFARQLLAPLRPLPHVLVPGWQSSDRPPLQTTLYLLVRAFTPFGDPTGLNYEVTGTFLQSLWMPALWCFFSATRLPRRAVAAALGVVLASGFVIVNSFYVWPKLFPAAFVVLITAVVFTNEWDRQRTTVLGGVLIGLGVAMAMLGHGGSALALIPLVVFVCARFHHLPRIRFVAAFFIVAVACLLPWTLYQTHYDPPGTRLTKGQLAGQSAIVAHQSLQSSIIAAYDRLSPGQIASRKWSNLETPFLNEDSEVTSIGRVVANLFARNGPGVVRRDGSILRLRSISFYFVLASTGFLALGFVALILRLVKRRERSEGLRIATRTWVWLLGSLFFWAIALFGPSYTLIHQGSYATELLLFAVLAIELWALSPRLFVAVGIVQLVLGLIVYGIFQPSWKTLLPLAVTTNVGEAVLGGVGFVLACSMALLGKPDAVTT